MTEAVRSPGRNFAAVLSRQVAGTIRPEHVAPLLVAVQCGTAAGTVRVGDVELTKQLVTPGVLGETDDAIARSLARIAEGTQADFPGFTHTLIRLLAAGERDAAGLQKDLAALLRESRSPWHDPALNVPAAVPDWRARGNRGYIAPARVWVRALGMVLGAVLAMALTAFALRFLLQ
jgi:hypothetical protein